VGAIFQVLNRLEHYSLKLIAQPTEGFDPFVHEVQDVLANLRFLGGRTVSIEKLAKTIPRFDPDMPQDAGEFLIILVNQVHEKLFDAANITNHIRGSLKTHIRADEINCTSTDGFFLPLIVNKRCYAPCPSIRRIL
jgi:hypothetical protein